MSPDQTRQPATLARGSWYEWRRIQEVLRTESVGGILLLVATVFAVVLANSPLSDTYFAVRDFHVGGQFGPLDLDLSIGHWAADGLLAVFFFMAGLELKREFVAGDLRDPRRALLPIVAAFCGAAVPALFYVIVAQSGGVAALKGWAIPTATDIAFALAVLAVIGSHLPSALRTFLLTLAIVDDLIAIVVIAFFYTSELPRPDRSGRARRHRLHRVAARRRAELPPRLRQRRRGEDRHPDRLRRCCPARCPDPFSA